MIKNDKKMKKTESIPSFSDELGNKADEKKINAANQFQELSNNK